MASFITTRGKLGLLKGELLAAHTYKIALFTSSWTGSASTTGYTSTNEASGGSGYTAGGASLTPTFSNNSTKAIVDYVDTTWTITGGPFAFRYGLVYDDTDTVIPDQALFALDFGAQSVTDATITIQWPAADATNAIFRIA